MTNFGGIANVDVSFGPGLNVLFGPNDLGKSTLAEAIRLALLLPHGSTYSEPYVPWAGGGEPVVDLIFATEAQRFWRVRKQFGKGGYSVLEESRNGTDFDEVERARAVDARLREVLCWGIPEPGGSGAGKGLPSSFLATALLSTQADVGAVLETSLEGDLGGNGKDRIAGALQAIAQDPLFVSLLRKTQERWDEAFTEKGKKSRAKGSVFASAAERVNQTREEKESLQKTVDESEGVEQALRQLVGARASYEDSEAAAAERLRVVEVLTEQMAAREAAAEEVRVASAAVLRIKQLGDDVAASERGLVELAERVDKLERGRDEARATVLGAAESLKQAESNARSAESAAEMADTVARQQLELRKSEAERAAAAAQQAIEVTTEGKKLVNAATAAEMELQDVEKGVSKARERTAQLAEELRLAQAALDRCEVLDRGLAARLADSHLVVRKAAVAKRGLIRDQAASLATEKADLEARRAALVIPTGDALAAMRKLERELAGARAALDVGLVATVTPLRPPLELRVTRDAGPAVSSAIEAVSEIEADSHLLLSLSDFATIQIRGGRPDARERVRLLEGRWKHEAEPGLTAADVQDLGGLEDKALQARDLDARLGPLSRQIEALNAEFEAFAGADSAEQEAATRAAGARQSLDGVSLESLAEELDQLGNDPATTLRTRRQRASSLLDVARKASTDAAAAQLLADQRKGTLSERLTAAVVARDAALGRFPEGLDTAAGNAQAALMATKSELHMVARDLASVQAAQGDRASRLSEAITGARDAETKARRAMEMAESEHMKAVTAHALERGRLVELQKRLALEDLSAAEEAARAAAEALAALPIPARALAVGELGVAREAVRRAKDEVARIDREIQRSQGALEQVGGAVARERLQDAVEACRSAERHERELEADYEAWKLLLESMKEADAAQASNLGQVLGPAIAQQFQALTEERYQGVQLTAHLGTEGVLVGGNLRSQDRISVGTREQLSTLYRLCLGEYLRTTVVLDDQLVQSDSPRMHWFRALLGRKARGFQIVVFTCRPEDYLSDTARPTGELFHADSDDGFARAFDLGRAVQRR